jgi:hypothetical protein
MFVSGSSRLFEGPPIGTVWLTLGSISMRKIAEPDAIVIDMQHGLWDRLSMEKSP